MTARSFDNTRLGKVFVKLPKHIGGVEYRQKDIQVSYEGAIEYFDVDLPKRQYILDLIPARYQKDFVLALMKINQPIPPHTDSQIKCTINIYLQTEPCMTEFYRVKPGATIYQVKNQTNGVLFDKKDLESEGGFIAAVGDIWVLNVMEPHSVEPVNEMTERVAITLATADHTFDEVIEMLSETGNL